MSLPILKLGDRYVNTDAIRLIRKLEDGTIAIHTDVRDGTTGADVVLTFEGDDAQRLLDYLARNVYVVL